MTVERRLTVPLSSFDAAAFALLVATGRVEAGNLLTGGDDDPLPLETVEWADVQRTLRSASGRLRFHATALPGERSMKPKQHCFGALTSERIQDRRVGSNGRADSLPDDRERRRNVPATG